MERFTSETAVHVKFNALGRHRWRARTRPGRNGILVTHESLRMKLEGFSHEFGNSRIRLTK